MNNAKMTKILSLAFATFVLVFVSGIASEVFAQGGRDPFQKNPALRKKSSVNRSVNTSKRKKKGPFVVEAPTTEARINYFKQVREIAATNGRPLPKPTSVILLSELAVTGIFRTPRGYAAIVKAEPINLSYTIYPGEKFFDGQLVAVEENRLVFRKVTKWSTGKFISSVENKPLRKYSDKQTFQGTAPIESNLLQPNPVTANAADKKSSEEKSASPEALISPLNEVTNSPAKEAKDSVKKDRAKDKKDASKGKKSSKVAKKTKPE